MDDARFRELDEKRRGRGLTAEEANELGRLDAERAGREYEGNAQNPPPEVEAEREVAGAEDVLSEREAAEVRRDVDDPIRSVDPDAKQGDDRPGT